MSSLVRHPDTPPGAIHTVEAEMQRIPGGVVATFRAIGDISRLVVPPPVPPERKDNLWQTTCFEIFITTGGTGYREFNLSPSGAWAAYDFDDFRLGMRDAPAAIEIKTSIDPKSLMLVAKISSELPAAAPTGLTAVIQEADAATRFWATAFAPGEAEFHAAEVRSLILDGVSAE